MSDPSRPTAKVVAAVVTDGVDASGTDAQTTSILGRLLD
jgi:hypothetical protein